LTASNIQIGKRIALVSISVSALLAIGKIIVGWWAGSTSVVADGMESAGDVLVAVLRNGHYTGRVVLKQRDFGITPVSIAGGTVKVKNELTIDFDIRPNDGETTKRR